MYIFSYSPYPGYSSTPPTQDILLLPPTQDILLLLLPRIFFYSPDPRYSSTPPTQDILLLTQPLNTNLLPLPRLKIFPSQFHNYLPSRAKAKPRQIFPSKVDRRAESFLTLHNLISYNSVKLRFRHLAFTPVHFLFISCTFLWSFLYTVPLPRLYSSSLAQQPHLLSLIPPTSLPLPSSLLST